LELTGMLISVLRQAINLVRNIMLTLPTNSANFFGRVFFLIVTFFLGYLFINFGLKEPNNGNVIFKISAIDFEFKIIHIVYFLITITGFLTFTIIVSLLSFNRIQVDTTSGTITFTGLVSRKIISLGDISEYFETTHRNRFKMFRGLLLKLRDKKTIQVAGQNIESLSDLKNYLDERGINCVGQKKMKFPFN
jgi:hypothetical protein